MNANRKPTFTDAGATVKVINETKTRWNESPICVGTRGQLRSIEDGWATVKFFGWYMSVAVPAKDLAIEIPATNHPPATMLREAA